MPTGAADAVTDADAAKIGRVPGGGAAARTGCSAAARIATKGKSIAEQHFEKNVVFRVVDVSGQDQGQPGSQWRLVCTGR